MASPKFDALEAEEPHPRVAGLSYYIVSDRALEEFAPIVASLTGR
ncbi:MAG TPA: hypothetical protein VK585_13720 [Jiangellaceae bacterium]|nr:hypothetical protein [Jiangellaceae bacterium]